MELAWESDFETGNEYVDGQHRYFVNLINRIRKIFRESNDIAYKEKLIILSNKIATYFVFIIHLADILTSFNTIPKIIGTKVKLACFIKKFGCMVTSIMNIKIEIYAKLKVTNSHFYKYSRKVGR